MSQEIQSGGLVARFAELSMLLPGLADSNQRRIAAELGTEILSGGLQPGDRLPNDVEMTKLFGVSRVVTREVVKTLAAKGMVASKVRVGTIVRDPIHWSWLDPDVLTWRAAMGMDETFLQQIFEVRRAVEPVAASLAASNATKADILRLREAITRMAEAEDDARRFARADLQFHLAVTAASHNPYFHAFAGMIETALLTVFSKNAASKVSSRSDTTAKHALIADAIAAKDTDGAARAMRKTIDDGLNRAINSGGTQKKRRRNK